MRMKSKFLWIAGFVVLFFFGEIAISFSDRIPANAVIDEESISFALNLDNKDSDLNSMLPVDMLISSFLENYDITGASVAVTFKDKLIYAKGFGYANVETNEKVHPGHLFRIASVSKLITAVSIMRLYEQGIIDLDEQVFGEQGILNDEYFLHFEDPLYRKITIRNLLNHTAGWSRYKGDPMFNSLYIARKLKEDPPARLDQVIAYTLQKNLDYEPGTTYSYSNLGYAILGKIIEIKTGMPYEDYVVMNILKPLGIQDMHIGRSLYHEKFPNEVRYYEPAGASKCLSFDGSGKMVDLSYGGNNIELLGAAGGWITSAPELAKFIAAIDDYPARPDILSHETIQMMTSQELAGEGLFGWRGSDKYGTWWRTGTLTGSTAFVLRMENGLNWVVLLNDSSYKRVRIHNKLSRTLFAATYRIDDWPTQDLFFAKNIDKQESISSIPVFNPQL